MRASRRVSGVVIATGIALGAGIGAAAHALAAGLVFGASLGLALEPLIGRRGESAPDPDRVTDDSGTRGANGKKSPISPDDGPD